MKVSRGKTKYRYRFPVAAAVVDADVVVADVVVAAADSLCY